MPDPLPSLVPSALLAASLLLAQTPALAFYEVEGGDSALDLRGNLRMTSSFADNPDPFGVDEHTFAILRLLADADVGQHLRLELNAYQVFTSTTAGDQTGGGQAATLAGVTALGGVGRSDALALHWSADARADALLEIDRLALHIDADRLTLTLGRQPINLATTFLFTPNDVFVPFAAQTFFREWKPGVDALRLDIGLGALTQLSLYAVLGYDRDALLDDDRLASPDLGQSAALARAQTAWLDFEWSLLGGVLADRAILGAGLQGELFEWLGVRAEGHLAFFEDDDRAPEVEATVELDHRFESTLDLRLAYFHHGAGVTDADDYLRRLTSGQDFGFYFARHYAALAAGYELTPLLHTQAALILNLVDASALTSLNLLYSVSDEADLAIIAALPLGDPPETTQILTATIPTGLPTEFGLYPATLGLDFRVYF